MYDYDGSLSRQYLSDDLALSCDSEEHSATRRTAFVMITIWPVGTPIMYGVLLWLSRKARVTGVSTPLSRATDFLAGDYGANGYWWELVRQ